MWSRPLDGYHSSLEFCCNASSKPVKTVWPSLPLHPWPEVRQCREAAARKQARGRRRPRSTSGREAALPRFSDGRRPAAILLTFVHPVLVIIPKCKFQQVGALFPRRGHHIDWTPGRLQVGRDAGDGTLRHGTRGATSWMGLMSSIPGEARRNQGGAG